MSKNITYNDVLQASETSVSHPFGFKYVIVELAEGDTCDNPASTKEHRRLHGPGIFEWEIHPSGIVVRERDGLGEIHKEIREGAASL